MKQTFNARQELNKVRTPFATQYGKYELIFTPHLVGSMIVVRTKEKDDLCGDWLLADAPSNFVVALGSAAMKLKERE